MSGESVNQVGGGICQVSSTIYYCVLHSPDLEVAERNHMFSVSYLPLGMDATVNWGTIDFKFKNNTDYPLKSSPRQRQDALCAACRHQGHEGIM